MAQPTYLKKAVLLYLDSSGSDRFSSLLAHPDFTVIRLMQSLLETINLRSEGYPDGVCEEAMKQGSLAPASSFLPFWAGT